MTEKDNKVLQFDPRKRRKQPEKSGGEPRQTPEFGFDPANLPPLTDAVRRAIRQVADEAANPKDGSTPRELPFNIKLLEIQDLITRIMTATNGCSTSSFRGGLDLASTYPNEGLFQMISTSTPNDWVAKADFYRALCVIARNRAIDGTDAPEEEFGEIDETLKKTLATLGENPVEAIETQDPDSLSLATKLSLIMDKVNKILEFTENCPEPDVEKSRVIVRSYTNEELFDKLSRAVPIDYADRPAYFRALCLVAIARAENSKKGPKLVK